MSKQKNCIAPNKIKKLKSHRIVTLSSLNMTENMELGYVDSYIVDYSGVYDGLNSWKPLSNYRNNVTVSSNSWKGLRERLNYQEKYVSGVA